MEKCIHCGNTVIEEYTQATMRTGTLTGVETIWVCTRCGLEIRSVDKTSYTARHYQVAGDEQAYQQAQGGQL